MSDLYDYTRWPNFSRTELVCTCCGRENPNVDSFTRLMDDVQLIRTTLDVSFKVTSPYRCPTHPIEARKARGGQHTIAAIDLNVPVAYYHELLREGFKRGMTGIGISCKGNAANRFIHFDKRMVPKVWSY